MANDTRMTIRLDAATRRKIERFAAREGISLNEALTRLVQRAPDGAAPPGRPRRYRLRARRVGFGFDIAKASRLAAELADEAAVRKRNGGR